MQIDDIRELISGPEGTVLELVLSRVQDGAQYVYAVQLERTRECHAHMELFSSSDLGMSRCAILSNFSVPK